MPKRIFAAFTLFLLMILGFHSPALAAFQLGLEAQQKNQQLSLDTTNLNWWFTDNFALRGDYSWNTTEIGLTALYKINPQSRTAFYFGLAENDLSGKIAPDVPLEQKTALIAGMEWNLSRQRSGLSLMIEAGINLNDFANQSSTHSGLAPNVCLSFNYRFPSTNPTEKTTVASAYNIRLLAKLITLEAPDEPFDGQVAVAAVVLNRIRSIDFPDSVSEVIYQRGQFKTATRITKTVPDPSALKAAKAALRGIDPSHGALYFYNPALCSVKARDYIEKAHFQVTARIGNHVFLR